MVGHGNGGHIQFSGAVHGFINAACPVEQTVSSMEMQMYKGFSTQYKPSCLRMGFKSYIAYARARCKEKHVFFSVL
jgi:hypothetical protein